MFSDKDLNATMDLTAVSGSLLRADWPAPANVRTLVSTRAGGVSTGVFAAMNPAAHVGDLPQAVAENRRLLQEQVPVPIAYLEQVHGKTAVRAADSVAAPLSADASVDNTGTAACAVMTADCLPVLFCDRAGTVVAAAHAGWRGLADGVLAETVAAMGVPPVEIMAWLGPAIGADAFEVGQDVYDAFCAAEAKAADAFRPIGGGKYLADIYLLAKQALRREGVNQIYGGGFCTVLQREHFFSYRRDGVTGRMLSAVWLEK